MQKPKIDDNWGILARLAAWACVVSMFVFIANNFLIFWGGLPGALAILKGEVTGISSYLLGYLQLASYILAVLLPLFYVWRSQNESAIMNDSHRLSAVSAYIVRAAFWAVLLIGISDTTLALLRSEDWMGNIFGDTMAKELTRPVVRGLYIQYPLIICGLIIASKIKSLGFTWLALMVVISEFLIVIARFIFSYEQPFMGDLVRFWYAALFLFASAYTLMHEGHVRVDVLYTNFSPKQKARFNAIGCLCLGIPICWVILTLGMWEKTHIINAPLLNFEVSQSGFGLYVKHLMAGFLLIYATSMMLQFCAYLLNNVAILNEKTDPNKGENNEKIPQHSGLKEI